MNSPEQNKQPSTPPLESNPLFSPPPSTHKRLLKTPKSHSPKALRHTHHHHGTSTPRTPHHQIRGKKNLFTTPTHSTTASLQQLQTPEPTPRVQRRKELSEAITFKSSHHRTLILGSSTGAGLSGSILFPLAHSTIGSGRRSFNSNSANGKLSLDSFKLDLKKSKLIDLEEDLNSTSSGDESCSDNEKLQRVTKKLDFGETALTIEEEELEVPGTPKHQVLTDDKVYQLGVQEIPIVKEKGAVEFTVKRKELVNPFIDDGNKVSRSKVGIDSSRFDSEMELINFKTGERIVKPLNDFQKSIKPKILDFANIPIEEADAQETPSTPTNEVKMNPLNIKPLKSSDLIQDDEIIKKSKPTNPFFLTSSARRKLDFEKHLQQSHHDDSKLNTSIEYISSKGKKVRANMDEEQIEIKPKKLNFDDC